MGLSNKIKGMLYGASSVSSAVFSAWCFVAPIGFEMLTLGLFPTKGLRSKCWKLGAVSGVVSVFCGYKTVRNLIRRRPTGLLDAWPKR